jgi:hypothetical protein
MVDLSCVSDIKFTYLSEKLSTSSTKFKGPGSTRPRATKPKRGTKTTTFTTCISWFGFLAGMACPIREEWAPSINENDLLERFNLVLVFQIMASTNNECMRMKLAQPFFFIVCSP